MPFLLAHMESNEGPPPNLNHFQKVRPKKGKKLKKVSLLKKHFWPLGPGGLKKKIVPHKI